MKREYTIIIPFTIQKADGKVFESVDDMAKSIINNDNAWEVISSEEGLNKLFSNSQDDADSRNSVKDDLKSKKNEENEKRYFYKSTFDVLYNTDMIFSCNILRLSNINNDNYKKVYMHVALIGVGLLILECNGDDEAGEPGWDIDPATEFKNVVHNSDEIKVGFPFPKPFVAVLYGETNSGNNKSVYDSFVLSRKCKDAIVEADVMDFFAHDLQLFTFCMIQKTALVHVDSITSEKNIGTETIWHGLINCFRKDPIEVVLTSYISFLNKYDLVETTSNRAGKELYKTIREEMNIPEEITRLEKKVDALAEFYSANREKWMNRLLAFLAIVDVIAGGLQVWFACH